MKNNDPMQKGLPGIANLRIGESKNTNTEIGGPECEYHNANAEIGAPRCESKNANTEIGDPEREYHNANAEIGGPRWYSRGYIPHFDSKNLIQHVTFHLADSLAKSVLERFEDEIQNLPKDKQDSERRKRIESWIDAGHGSCILQEPSIAQMVQDSLLYFDGKRYQIFAWVVMPNHVHVLFQPINNWPLAKIVESWKKFTATRIAAFRRNANLRIGESHNANAEIGGPRCEYHNANAEIGDPECEYRNATTEIGGPERTNVWHREYWDRFMRDERHFLATMEYIHYNPVKTGLVAKAEDWVWSSASNIGDEANRVLEGKANTEIGGPEQNC